MVLGTCTLVYLGLCMGLAYSSEGSSYRNRFTSKPCLEHCCDSLYTQRNRQLVDQVQNANHFFFVFRPSATVSRIGLKESCTCHHSHCHCYGRGTTPTHLVDPPTGLTPPKLSATKWHSLMESHLCHHCHGGPPTGLTPLAG